MTSNDFESNNKNKKNEQEPEMMEFTAIVENNRASKKKKVKFNPKVFLRSLLMTLLIAVLAFVGWRAGVFISDYITALNNGMSSSQALQYAWNGTVDFFSDMVDPAPEKVYEDKNILVIGALDNSEHYSVNLTPDITGITDGYIIRADDETVGQSVLCSALSDYCEMDYEFLSGEEKKTMMMREEVKALEKWPSMNCVTIVDDTIVIKLGTEGEKQ